ncbi:MAG: 2'-5' RNA ligase family protein [Bacteroidia bacterium]
MPASQLYFIALVCPEPLQGEITAIKNYFLEKYNCKVALKSPAHITLIPPFALNRHNEHELIEYLLEFKINISNISITINGFGHFDKRTIFLHPESNDAVNQLQFNLHNYLKQKLFHNKSNSHFSPHITVANRDIKPNDFDEAWEIFKDKEFKATFKVEQFALLKLIDKKWKVIAEFSWEEL